MRRNSRKIYYAHNLPIIISLFCLFHRGPKINIDLLDRISYKHISSLVAGWSSLVARRAHNPKVIGSNPIPATKQYQGLAYNCRSLFVLAVHKTVHKE